MTVAKSRTPCQAPGDWVLPPHSLAKLISSWERPGAPETCAIRLHSFSHLRSFIVVWLLFSEFSFVHLPCRGEKVGSRIANVDVPRTAPLPGDRGSELSDRKKDTGISRSHSSSLPPPFLPLCGFYTGLLG